MRKLPITAATVILFIFSSWALAMDIFPLDDLKPGQKGIGKTVIAGAGVEDFDVEILGLVPQSPPLGNLIMVRVSGEVMEKTGGVALGMSGTPVYINDRLVGAIGYTYGLTDHNIALVTPAEAMFKIYENMPAGRAELPANAVPVTSPLVVGGMNRRATEFLKEAFSFLPVQVMPAAGRNENVQEFPLEAGSMLGVQLLRGDFQVASFGTVTHVMDDGRFIAFGHPFTHGGDVAFFATNAYVHHTLPSLEIPFKIVSLGPTLGGIWQDRAAGLGGSLGGEPPYLPVTIVVEDQGRHLRQEYKVESITEETLMIPLLISSAYESIDATLDRVGAGTSYVRLEFGTGNLSQRMIRENLFYSDSDIAVWSLTDLWAGLELLIDNNLQAVDLQHVQIEIEVTPERKTATIEKARPKMSYVAAGESVDVEVVIRPYRQETETRIMRIDIPANTSPGPLTVTVRSGGAGYFVSKPPVHTPIIKEGDLNDEDSPSRAVISGAESLDVLVEEYMDREKNNEIVAEFYPFFDN
ncbi:MAG TPA: hypothetical protein GX528_09750, partial [Firmicutes bacterium]|nr:hypothetical protein [Bacillota bacterium]